MRFGFALCGCAKLLILHDSQYRNPQILLKTYETSNIALYLTSDKPN